MRNKVVLIQPKNTLALNIYPPLNLIELGSALEAKGYTAEIITCPIIKQPQKAILKECRDALMVGISVLTPEVPDAIRIAKLIKKEYKIPIVWGGWHATLFSEQTAASSLADKVVVNEGDELVVKIADFYRDNGFEADGGEKVLRNEKKIDLGLLLEPDYSLVDDIEYYINAVLGDKFLEYDKRAVRWLPYEASRGCPFDCAFCINAVTDNQRHRKKSPKKVINEIESIVKKYILNHIKIIDDNFFVDTRWVKEIAQGLIDRNLDITWDAECRVDYFNERQINDECLNLLTRSGLNELNFGIESGSQRTLDIMKKGITPKQSLDAVLAASRHGIVSRCSFVIDVPGERKEDIYETVRLINQIRKVSKTTCGVHTYRPYPRSELCEELLRNNIIKQPSSLEAWANKEFVEQFTYTDARRKWQKNNKISCRISFYQCLESGFWLKPHQIRNRFISAINSFFMKLAGLRNRNLFYNFSADRYLYVFFKNLYYKYRQWGVKS